MREVEKDVIVYDLFVLCDFKTDLTNMNNIIKLSKYSYILK